MIQVFTRTCCYTNRVRWANYKITSCKFPVAYTCNKLRKLFDTRQSYCNDIKRVIFFLDHTVVWGLMFVQARLVHLRQQFYSSATERYNKSVTCRVQRLMTQWWRHCGCMTQCWRKRQADWTGLMRWWWLLVTSYRSTWTPLLCRQTERPSRHDCSPSYTAQRLSLVVLAVFT